MRQLQMQMQGQWQVQRQRQLLQNLRWQTPVCLLLVGLLLLVLAGTARAQNLLPVPALTSRVVDTSGTLNAGQQQALDSKLSAFEAASGSQVVVLMVSSTQPEDIASYANRVGSTWKIGRKDIGDGLLLVVAKDDRKLRIEVARTLEGAVPDLAAKRVIDQAITPRFKQGDFAGGIDAGLDQIFALIRNEELPAPAQSGGTVQTMPLKDMAITGGFLLFMAGAMARNVFGPVGAGSVVIGSVAGALSGGVSWLLLGSQTVTLWAAISGLVLGFLGGFVALLALLPAGSSGLATNYRANLPRDNYRAANRNGWGSGGFGGGSGGGGFSSGGGGGFGGGGASGGW